MQSIDSCASCDFPRTREVLLLGRKVRMKNYLCSLNGEAYRLKPEKIRLQLSILLTRYCNARCPFCIAAPTTDPATLSPDCLDQALRLLKAEDCIRGISITGGEPFCRPELLDYTISRIFEIFGFGMEISLYTNGTGLSFLPGIRELRHVDTVHISRHHWEDRKNDAVFGRRMPSSVQLKEWLQAAPWPGLYVMNCLLLRDGVASPEDARRYMDWALDAGASKVSFITGNPVNENMRRRQVLFEEALPPGDPHLLFTREYRDFSWCRCRDGVYVTPEGKLLEFYGRQTEPSGCDYCRGLVLEPDGRLTAGFGGEVLWQGGASAVPC